MNLQLILSKDPNSSFSQFCERSQKNLQIYRPRAKIIAILQAVDMMLPYYLLFLKSRTRDPLAERNVLN